MAFQDPRGSLPYSGVQILPLAHSLGDRRRLTKYPSSQLRAKTKTSLCLDWILSSATNIHVAVDKAAFKTYYPFETFLLVVSDQRRIPVKGVGEVELKIRCRPGSKECRLISLDTVLHVPDWICNILSDVYFVPVTNFEHKWSVEGLRLKVKQNGKLKPWGYTEEFRGLDRLVLSRKEQGRSPMLEDSEREVWSVNLHWPESQRKRWQARQDQNLERSNVTKHKSDPGATEEKHLLNTEMKEARLKQARKRPVSVNLNSQSEDPTSQRLSHVLSNQISAMSLDLERIGQRMSLNNINKNIAMPADSGVRVSSLRATLSNRGLIRELIHGPK